MIVVIDDERSLSRQFTASQNTEVVTLRSSSEALEFFRDNEKSHLEIERLYLDHDLGGDDTIMPVVDYLAEQAYHGNDLGIEMIHIHTMNPAGRRAMHIALGNYYDVRLVGLEDFGAVNISVD